MLARVSSDAAPPAARPRRYRSQRRARQAAQTRRDVLDAAVRLFARTGWNGTTLTAIAAEADVAVETVYSGFGSKRALVRRAFEAAVVGDAEDVAFEEREEFRRLGRGPREERLRAAAEALAAIHARSSGVWRALSEASNGDAEMAAWCAELEENRRTTLAHALERVLERPVTGELLDMLWAVAGPEVYLKLVGDRGWTADAYQRWMRDTWVRLAPAPSAG